MSDEKKPEEKEERLINAKLLARISLEVVEVFKKHKLKNSEMLLVTKEVLTFCKKIDDQISNISFSMAQVIQKLAKEKTKDL